MAMQIKGRDNVRFHKPPAAGILTDRRKIKEVFCDVLNDKGESTLYAVKGAAYTIETDTWILVGERRVSLDEKAGKT